MAEACTETAAPGLEALSCTSSPGTGRAQIFVQLPALSCIVAHKTVWRRQSQGMLAVQMKSVKIAGHPAEHRWQAPKLSRLPGQQGASTRAFETNKASHHDAVCPCTQSDLNSSGPPVTQAHDTFAQTSVQAVPAPECSSNVHCRGALACQGHPEAGPCPSNSGNWVSAGFTPWR